MLVAVGFAVSMMSLEYQNISPGGDLEKITPTAYKNLLTYQEGELSLFRTTAPNGQKIEKFKTISRKALGRQMQLPTSRTGAVTRYGKEDPTAFYSEDIKSGKLSFNKGMKPYLEKGGRDLPSQRKANELSRAFLQESGLAPKNKEEIKMMHSGGLRASEAGSERVINVLRTVTYGRFLNGVPVYGSSSKIIVQVGNGGEIVGASSLWKEVDTNTRRKVSKAETKTAKEAEVEMKKRLLTDFGKSARAEIKNMALAYYDGGKNYIQPAYFFEIEVNIPQARNAPEVKFNYMGIIPALRKAPEAIEALQTPRAADSNIEKLSTKPPTNVRKKDPRDID